MDILYYLMSGAAAGSFLNVCIYRIPRGESVVLGSSRCPGCGGRIKAFDLLPVISYFLLRGRCRHCGVRIPYRYPLVEAASGLLWALLYLEFGSGQEFFKAAAFLSLMIVLGITDLDTGYVYSKTTALGAAAGLAFALCTPGTAADCIAGALAGFAPIAAFAFWGGMGWGDAEICLICGLFLGFSQTLVMLFISFVIGGTAGLIAVACAGKGRGDCLPFGPFIAASAVATIFFGNEMVMLYLGMIV